MYIGIINPEIDGHVVYANTGSSHKLVAYLQHDVDKKSDAFFAQERDNIDSDEVNENINSNIKGLKATSEKFYSLYISPNEGELKHIKNHDNHLRSYTRVVMEKYASNFKLKNDQKLTSENLVWFAVIHNDRRVKSVDLKTSSIFSKKEKELIDKLRKTKNSNDLSKIYRIESKAKARDANKLDPAQFKVGDIKPGLNKHVHIVVSARDAAQKITLNPRTLKRRFNIKAFQMKSARVFQKMFHYDRETIQDGFFNTHTQKEKEKFKQKIKKAVKQINQNLKEVKLDAAKILQIGENRQFSRVFFINLSKLKGKFQRGETLKNPYFFLSNGRDQKEEEYNKDLNEKFYHNEVVGERETRSHHQEQSKTNFRNQEKQTEQTSSSNETSRSHRVIIPSKAVLLLNHLQSLPTGPGMIKQTLLLEKEREKFKRGNKKNQGYDVYWIE